jgi:hypothetical protein
VHKVLADLLLLCLLCLLRLLCLLQQLHLCCIQRRYQLLLPPLLLQHRHCCRARQPCQAATAGPWPCRCCLRLWALRRGQQTGACTGGGAT